MTLTFRAAVQYDDWQGTAAADNLDTSHITDLLVSRGLMSGDEFLIGVTFYLGENHPANANKQASVRAVILPSRSGFEEAKAAIDQTEGKLATRTVDLSLSLVEFVDLFKRLSIVLTRRGLALEDRPYAHSD